MLPPDIEQLIDSPAESAGIVLRTPLFIYGAGNAGKDVARVLLQRGVAVSGFLDRQAAPGATWQSLPIRLPDSSDVSPAERAGAQVVLGLFNRDVDIPPIVEMLRALGYGSVLTFLDLHKIFPNDLGDRFWLTGSREGYRGQGKQILAASKLFFDDASRDLFYAVLRFRLTGDYDTLPAPGIDDQYFAQGLPPWPTPLRLIDCGAYDGDTLRHLARLGLPVEALASFEPDPENFAKLAPCAKALFPAISLACLYPCGVGAKTEQLRFTCGQGESSGASAGGDTVIQCVALDEALSAFRPNLIKMDIEGAESEALRGARGLIEQHQPGLAISVYHRPEHLWELPLLVAPWLRGGRHYLRAHGHSTFDLIHYWLP